MPTTCTVQHEVVYVVTTRSVARLGWPHVQMQCAQAHACPPMTSLTTDAIGAYVASGRCGVSGYGVWRCIARLGTRKRGRGLGPGVTL
jgi:hypothetical protein